MVEDQKPIVRKAQGPELAAHFLGTSVKTVTGQMVKGFSHWGRSETSIPIHVDFCALYPMLQSTKTAHVVKP